uniref:Ovule protein n=1 Tax=Mesocestoides corti TaxID=53468 RepID=A0A5K3FZA0_MESCO
MPEKLCPRLAFDSTSLAHYRKKKKSPLSLPLCSLIDEWHSCPHAVVVANTFLLPFSIIVDCVCDTAIAFCLKIVLRISRTCMHSGLISKVTCLFRVAEFGRIKHTLEYLH